MVITESSESVLLGTKQPPFRMLATAVDAQGRRVPGVRPAVSEEFVVVTKRTKTLEKQEIPSLDDPINRLNHIGALAGDADAVLGIAACETVLDNLLARSIGVLLVVCLSYVSVLLVYCVLLDAVHTHLSPCSCRY